MNTIDYFKQVICDEIKAIKEGIGESKFLTAAFLAAIVGLVIYLKPFPARHINFLTGYPGADWTVLAESAATILKKNGLELSIVHTNGALENAMRLDDPNDQANAGFTYGLALDGSEVEGIYSLGSVSYDPVWILYDKNRLGEIKTLPELARLKVALGPVQSGSYRIAKKIFDVADIKVENNPHFSSDSIINNQAKLKNGEVDVMVVVSTNLDRITKELLLTPNIAVFDFKNASAYAKQVNSFVTLTLPADSLNVANQSPKTDITLLATTSSLVVKRSMHPDLQLALLMAARDASRNSPNLFFAKRDEFPAYRDPLIPISPVAEHFYNYGPPYAVKYLPYWLAGFIDRAWILLLTILAVFYPLSKLNIHFRKFRFNLKEIPHYKELLEMERRIQKGSISSGEKEEMLKRLNEINAHAIKSGVPISEEAAYFSFLNAIFLIKRKLDEA